MTTYTTPAMKTATKTDPYKTKFHRDGTLTFWSVYEQRWNRTRAEHVSDENLASMSAADRKRTLRTANIALPIE